MEDRRRLCSILYPLFSILVFPLAGCQTPPPTPARTEPAAPLNYTAYLYSLYDTEYSSRPTESVKEDRLNFKPHAALVVARLGEYAPREALLRQLRAETNLFSRVEGIPAVLEISGQSPPGNDAQAKAAQGAVKEHIVKMRQLATDIGADYLYLLGGTFKSYTAQELYNILDLTIAGYFLLASNRIEVESRASGALIDVASGRVVAVVTEEGKKVTRVPTAVFDEQKVKAVDKANAQLEETLTKRLIGQIESRMGGK